MNEFWTSILRDPQLEAYWEKKENEVSNMIYEIQVATWKKEDLEMGINAGFPQAPFNEEKMKSIINMMVNNSMKNAGAVDDEAE